MKRAAALLLIGWGSAFGQTPSSEYPIDPKFAQVEEKLSEEVSACTNGRSLCERTARSRLEREFPFRGSRKYVQTYYLPMSTLELLGVRKELLAQGDSARSQRDFWVDNPRPPGELTREMIRAELQLVDAELKKRNGGGARAVQDLTHDIGKIFKKDK
jgi:hypothetical protein